MSTYNTPAYQAARHKYVLPILTTTFHIRIITNSHTTIKPTACMIGGAR